MGCGSSTESSDGHHQRQASLLGGEKEEKGVGSREKHQLISPSLAYCLLQDVPTHSVIFFDARDSDAYERHHIREAVHPWAHKGADEAKFREWLRNVTRLRTVVIYSDASDTASQGSGSSSGVGGLLDWLSSSQARPKEVLIVKGGLQAFSRRFGFCVVRGSKGRGRRKQPSVPLPTPSEIIAPKRSGRGFALYVCGEGVLKNSPQSVRLLRVRTVVNLTQRPCPLDRKPRVVHLSCYDKAELPYDEAARVVRSSQQRNRAVLVYDHSGDVHSAAVVVWFMVEQGTSVSAAMAHVKRKRGSVQFDSYVTSTLTRLEEAVKQGGHGLATRPKMVAPQLQRDAQAQLTQGTVTPAPETAQPPPGSSLQLPPPPPPPSHTQDSTPRAATQAVTRPNGTPPLNHQSSLGTDMSSGAAGLYSKVDDMILRLKSSLPPDEYQECIRTVSRLFTNVLAHATDDKYRSVRMANERFMAAVGRHPTAIELLVLGGFVRNAAAETYQLPQAALLQKLRDINSRLLLHTQG
ncbi:unnamed protein product [Vitrella brassicaformis CCMP3155]|uniref:Rhodanese domain-containing protein n=2 Tax=Vitrella brassicaformis TaxID=1169539 RepID=A0A0G4GN88_VITBC|nr:unnamed protein product [Vitrella brassicaformis CCMP3155]|eukprot:CEM31657.1 unnamed protein product [Vitrella brassicaformis CCMP3155]